MSAPDPGSFWPWVLAALLISAGYLTATTTIRRRGGAWPYHRDGLWCAAVAAAFGAVCEPVVARPGFPGHMIGHLLLGMAAPLLLVLAAPITLVLRILPVGRARVVTRFLRSRPVRILTHPAAAGFLNTGGLWLLYTTGLYRAAEHDAGLHLMVQAHVFAAGYLFIASVVTVDPMPHRPSRMTRAVSLLVFLAAHDILAKFLYAHPPLGVPAGQARAGSEVMYYGGDLADLALLVVFCRQWYVATGPARRSKPHRPGRWRLAAEFRGR